MLKNYFLVIIRHLARNKGYTAINIFGLFAGLTASFLITLYVANEYSYDSFLSNSDRKFRLFTKGVMGGEAFELAVTPGPLVKAAKADSINTKYATGVYSIDSKVFFAVDGKKYYEQKFFFTDSHFPKIFNTKIVTDFPESELDEPYTVFLSKSIAKKYFGNTEPLGKKISWNNTEDYTVRGIFEDPPVNSHINYDMLLSSKSLAQRGTMDMDTVWLALTRYTYVELNESAIRDSFIHNLNSYFLAKNIAELKQYGIQMSFHVQPILDIHLKSRLKGEMHAGIDPAYIIVLVAVAIFILLLAAVNFMNLSTAQSANRAKESGIRKVLGSSKRQMVARFLGESVVLSFVALLPALMAVELLLPVFNDLAGKKLVIEQAAQFQYFGLFVLIALAVGLLSGIYPAFFITGTEITKVLKGDISRGKTSIKLRNLLVIFQFSVSVTLLISTQVIYKQLHYLQNRKVGFSKNELIIVPLRSADLRGKGDSISTLIKNIPGIESISLSSHYPGAELNSGGYATADSDFVYLITRYEVDENYLNATGIKLAQGRFFDRKLDDTMTIVVNQFLVNKFGWEDPLNEVLRIPDVQSDSSLYVFKVVGVVEDYNFRTMNESIGPLVLHYNNTGMGALNIRVTENKKDETIALLEKKWQEIDSIRPFDYIHVSELFDSYFISEKRFAGVFLWFTGVSYIIAALGLFGLTSYLAEQKTKEIGIRKVLGASASDVALLLTRKFIMPVLAANLVAWPAAAIYSQIWLKNFAYAVPLSLDVFLIGALVSIVIALATVYVKAYKTATMNPVNSLKYE